MTKGELLKAVATKSEVSQEKVNSVINALAEVIVKSVRDDADSVAIPGLGTFKQKATAAHQGRNPMTGESIDVPASKTIGFKPQSNLKVVG